MPKPPVGMSAMLNNPDAVELPLQPHPLVAAWMKRQREAEAAARAESRSSLPKLEDTHMGRCELRISDAPFKAAEVKGYGLECPEGYLAPVSVRLKERRVVWSLHEQTSPRRVPLSKKDLKKPRNIARGIMTETIHVPTGTFKLVATIDGSTKTQISERLDKPFEQRIDEVLGRFEKLADTAIARDARHEEQHQEFLKAMRARERIKRLDVMEKARWKRLRKQAQHWQEAKSLRAFVNSVECALGEQSGRATAWLEWARWRVDWLDPLSDGAASARDITRWRYAPVPSEYELQIWALEKLDY